MGIKISVVIASLNCETVIEQAICSFIAQKYKDKELVIVDGESTDGTLSVINRYRAEVSVLLSEKDHGIYDAYNKGVAQASGDYVIFLGADDSFYDRNTLTNVAKLIAEKKDPDLLCTAIYYIEDGWACIEKKTILYHWKEGLKKNQPMIPHQGLYTKKRILTEHPFSLEYEICSDFEFYLYCLKTEKKIEYADIVTAFFSRQGISSKNEKKKKTEEMNVLKKYEIKGKNDMIPNMIRGKLRRWIRDYRFGVTLLIRLRGFKIHRCKNRFCRWCDHNQRRIKNRQQVKNEI